MKTFIEQIYFCITKRFSLRVSGGELSKGEMSGSRFFQGGHCPGGNCPGGNWPHADIVLGGTVRGELSGGIYRSSLDNKK